MNKNHKTYKIRPVRPKNLHLKVAWILKVYQFGLILKRINEITVSHVAFQSTAKSWHAVILLIVLKVGPNWK